MTVFVVYTEYQNGDDLAALHGVFASQAGADKCRAVEIARQEKEYGNRVWNHAPDCPDEGSYLIAHDTDDWDVAVVIEAFEVQP